METNEISIHAVRVFSALAKHPTRWMTNAEIVEEVDGVAPRTVRLYTLRFAQAGIVDQAEVFPAHRYRLATKAKQRNRGYLERLIAVAEILGEPLDDLGDGLKARQGRVLIC